MIKNYLKTAWRSLVLNKATSAISVAGLAVGICCFLLLATYLINELRYDRFHEKADRIVRIAFNYKSPDDIETTVTALSPTAPVPVFKQQVSDIEDGVRIYNYTSGRPATVQYGDKIFAESGMLVADNSFFKMFSFKFVAGDAATALADPTWVVINQSIAKKYFGSDSPIGKVLKVNQKRDLMVTGVIEDVPEYSQIKFEMMGNYAMLDRSKVLAWDSANDFSYLLLKPGANVHSTRKR